MSEKFKREKQKKTYIENVTLSDLSITLHNIPFYMVFYSYDFIFKKNHLNEMQLKIL